MVPDSVASTLTTSWVETVDAAPWADDSPDRLATAIRATADRVTARRLQHRLAAEYGPGSVWALSATADVAAHAASIVETERAHWLPPTPLTTLADIEVVPYDEPLDAVLARARATPEDVRANLTLGTLLEPTSALRALGPFLRARSASPDPAVRVYALLHGSFDTCEFAAEVLHPTPDLEAPEVSARLRADFEDVGVIRFLSAMPHDEALRAAHDAPTRRRLLDEAVLQGLPYTTPTLGMAVWSDNPAAPDAPRAIFIALGLPEEREQWGTFARMVGPSSIWWASADDDAREHVARLVSRAPV
jgi:hypothetical protein